MHNYIPQNWTLTNNITDSIGCYDNTYVKHTSDQLKQYRGVVTTFDEGVAGVGKLDLTYVN